MEGKWEEEKRKFRKEFASQVPEEDKALFKAFPFISFKRFLCSVFWRIRSSIMPKTAFLRSWSAFSCRTQTIKKP